jgi:16S rRNA C1402 (ribose-2'-O) methylase RsmI
MLGILGDRDVALGRELTKFHETLAVRPISKHLDELGTPRGEYTLVVSPRTRGAAPAVTPDLAAVEAEFRRMTADGPTSKRDVVRSLARKFGTGQREMYSLLESLRGT